MLFAYPGEYEPCGLFTIDHFKLIIITIIGIIIALKKTANKTKEEVKQIIKRCTIAIWILEAIKIAFKLKTEGIRNINNYVPLYYCSLLLYAGALASFAKGKLQRMGEVFLSTGGIAGGLIFIIMPTTSLPTNVYFKKFPRNTNRGNIYGHRTIFYNSNFYCTNDFTILYYLWNEIYLWTKETGFQM